MTRYAYIKGIVLGIRQMLMNNAEKLCKCKGKSKVMLDSLDLIVRTFLLVLLWTSWAQKENWPIKGKVRINNQ